jgi:hypothetical protein
MTSKRLKQSSRQNKSSLSKTSESRPVFQQLESRLLMAAIPALSSRPAAYQKLYIDFNGDYTAKWGTYAPGSTPAYDTDGNSGSLSAGEVSNIQQIWAGVAEKYSPFNIDVTTVDPGNENNGQTMRVVVGGNGGWAGSGGGIAYINGFKNSSPNTAYVFSSNLASGTPKYVAEAVAHEAGHGFGLNHQSSYSGSTKTAAYNSGNGATAPIMGNSYTATRGLWWYGQNEMSASTYQDDLSVLGNTIGYRSDDAGNWTNAAASLSLSGTAASASGVIERTSDWDYYSFYTSGGSVSFTANPSNFGGMLDLQLSIVNSAGNTIANANSATLGESVSSYLSAGTYYVAVGSRGNYGDVGQYSISGSIGGGGTTTNPSTGGNTGGDNTSTVYAPSAPSNVRASAASATQVSLSWADNSTNETGFKIERLLDGVGGWSQVATVGAGVTAFVDSGLAAGTSYAYRIRAVNAGGDSAYSNIAWVSTLKSGGTTTTPTTPPPTTSTPTTNGTGTKVTGTPIGTTGSWNNSGNDRSKALDGDLWSYFDSNVASGAYVGYDLGSAKVISSVRFAPRSGLGFRMVGGQFQGSNDNSNWTNLFTVNSTPSDGQYTTGSVGNSTAFRYVRYLAPAGSYGNVADVEFYSTDATTSTPSTNTGSQLRGTAIGTAGSWANSGNTFDKAFDGRLDTFVDAPSSQAWSGIDLGSQQYVSTVKFAPRSGSAERMVGGVFQGSNDNWSWTTLHTINSTPSDGTYTTVSLSNPGSYRYVRYLSPVGGYGNIAELQFFSGAASADEEIVVITTPIESDVPEAHLTPNFSDTSIADVFGSDHDDHDYAVL